MKLSTTSHYKIKFCLYGLKEMFPFLLSDFLHINYIINNHERGGVPYVFWKECLEVTKSKEPFVVQLEWVKLCKTDISEVYSLLAWHRKKYVYSLCKIAILDFLTHTTLMHVANANKNTCCAFFLTLQLKKMTVVCLKLITFDVVQNFIKV